MVSTTLSYLEQVTYRNSAAIPGIYPGTAGERMNSDTGGIIPGKS